MNEFDFLGTDITAAFLLLGILILFFGFGFVTGSIWTRSGETEGGNDEA